MDIKPNGTRYYEYKQWDVEKYAPYDYERHGLIKHLLSPSITNTNNVTTRIILTFYEKSLVFLMKYVDRLKHFKDISWKNR